jgi:dTDP-4-dehydrorhamnose reductase
LNLDVKMKTLLIIGVSGLTGYSLARLASEEYRVYGTYNHREIAINRCEVFQLDKTEKEDTRSLIEKLKPDIVIDCSALHNVDYCENHHEECWKVNTESPIYIASICKTIDSRIIFISTDYVFDGALGNYTEENPTNPLNYYGYCKLKTEQELINIGVNYAVARTSLVYGWNPGEVLGLKSSSGKTMNFVIWVLNKLRNREPIKIVTDQYSTPTFNDNLAQYLLAMAKSNINGIFHATGKDCLNRYDFTLKIAKIFDLDQNLITPITSETFTQAAKRPMRCCLDTTKVKDTLGILPQTVEESLKIMKNQETEL